MSFCNVCKKRYVGPAIQIHDNFAKKKFGREKMEVKVIYIWHKLQNADNGSRKVKNNRLEL